MHGYAVTANRLAKAQKIESVLCDFLGRPVENLKILDIGCGSGHIAKYLAARNEVIGADLVDQVSEECKGSFDFKRVTSEKLPFEDGSFDVVISNHVIAYLSNHQLHFSEIHRILKETGVAYFATPNRYFPIEPHYKTPLINYLPNSLYLRFLKWRGMYKHDIYLVGYRRMIRLMNKAGLRPYDYTIKIIREPRRFHLKQAPITFIPGFFSMFSPTNIFLLTK